MMMLSRRVQYCRSLPRPQVIPAYSFVFFIWPGQFLIFLIIILQQQSRALAHLQTTESSSTTTTTANWDLLPSNTFTLQSYSTATSPPMFDRMTSRSSEGLTDSDPASIKISNGNFNEMTLQKHSLTRDSATVLSMTSTPNSIGFHTQLSVSGCVSSHCRLESSSSFTISGSVIPILERPASSQLTPKSSSRLSISGSPLAGPTSAMKTSSPGFIIMADATATTMGSHHRMKKKRHRKRKKKKRKKKRKKKKSRRKGRRTTAQWGVEELRKTTQAARAKKKTRVKWVADHRRNPTHSPAAILSSDKLKSVSSMAPVQKLMTPSSLPSKMISQPTSLTEVMEKLSQTIKPTPVFKASRVPAKQSMTLPNLISSRLLQNHMIKPHLPTPPLPLTAQTTYYDELSQVHLHSASFIHPSLTKNQIPTPITNSKSSESKPLSLKFNTLSSSFSFHSIHKSDFSSLFPFETSSSSLKDFPDEDKLFHTINPTKSSYMEPPQSKPFSQREISIHPTPSKQSSTLHPSTNHTAYINSTKSVNPSKYKAWGSVLVFQARRPPIIEKSFEINENTLTKSRFIDNSVFHTLSQIHSSDSFVEPEFSHNVVSTVSDKSVSKTEFPSSITPLSVSDVSEKNYLHFIDTVLNYTNTNDSNSIELPILSSSTSTHVSSASGLSSFNSLFPLIFPSQIRAKHKRTSEEITSKNDMLNNFEHLKKHFSQSNSVDQSIYSSLSLDFVSNSVPSSKLFPSFSKEFPKAEFSSFADSVNPIPISPRDLFTNFDLTDSSQLHSGSDIHSAMPLNESPPLESSFPSIFDTNLTHTTMPAWFTLQLPVNEHTQQTANILRDEKIFNLVFHSKKIQNNKRSSDIFPQTIDITASDHTNNLIQSSSLLLSLEQESKSTSNFMSSYSEENIFLDDFPLLPSMIFDQDSSYNSIDILSSSFLKIVSSDLASPEQSLKPNIPNMSSIFMPLESTMFSVTSSSNDLSPSLLESFSQSLSSILITEEDLNIASSTDDSLNTLFSMPELSNLSFPSAAGVNPDSWTASDLSTMDSRAFINDSKSQLVDGDVSITTEQLTSSEYMNEYDSMSHELSDSTNQFIDYLEFSKRETIFASSFVSTDLPSQSKLFDLSWTFDSDIVEDKLVFTSYPISDLIPPASDSGSIHSSTPYLSSNFVLESSSASLVWMLPFSSLPQWPEDVNAMVDPAPFGSGDMISSNPLDVDSGNWDFPLPDQLFEFSLSSPQITSYLESQLIDQSLFTSQEEKSSHQSTKLPDSSSHLYSSFSLFEPSKVISSQPILLPVSSQESLYIESSQLISEPLLELSEQMSPSLYWLDTSSVASEQFPWFEASDSTLSVMVEQSQIPFLFEVESSEWASQVELSPVSEAISIDIDSTEIQSQSEYLFPVSKLSPQFETFQPTSHPESSTDTSDLSAAFANLPSKTSARFMSLPSSQIIPHLLSQFTSQMSSKIKPSFASQSQYTTQVSLQTPQMSSQLMPSLSSKFTPKILSQFIPHMSSQIMPSLSSTFISQVSSQITPQISSQIIPSLSSQFTPLVSSQIIPSFSSQFIPQVSSQIVPSLWSQFTLLVSSQIIPSLSSQFTPQVSSQIIPSLSSQFTPQVSSQIVPSPSSQFTLLVSSQIIPSLSSQFTPLVSSQIIPSLSSQFTPQVSSQIIPSFSSQFTPQVSSQIVPSLSSQFTLLVSSQIIPSLSSQFTPQVSSQIIPSLSSQFTPQVSSQIVPSPSSQFILLVSSQIMPSLSSQFTPQISSQFMTSLSSQFTPQVSSQIIPSLSSQFTLQMSSLKFTSQISSQIIPSLTSQFEIQTSQSLQLTSQLDSSHPVLSLSIRAKSLQLTSSELFSETEYPQQTLQLSTESISHMQSSLPIAQTSLESDLSHRSSQLSSSTQSIHTSLYTSSYSSKDTSQSTPLFSPELETTLSTISSSKMETFYSIPDLTSQIMSSDSQSQLHSTSSFSPHSILPKLNSTWFSLRTHSTLKTGTISVSSFGSTLMPTISVTKTLSHELNPTSLFHPTTKFVNHSTSDVNKSTKLITSLDITLPATAEPMLNLSQAFQNYWVVTVIKVRLSVNVSTMAFRREMERNLARAYAEAYHIGARILNGTFQPLRKKRYVQVQDIALQMINISRTPTNSSNNVTMVYYMEKGGKPVPAISAARHLKLLQPQELAIHLKQVVVLPARTFLKPPHPEPSKDWIIGAVLGTLASALFLIWCILFIYFKCFRMRPTKSINTKSATPQLVLSTSMQDVNTDTSETALIRDEMQIHRQASLHKKNGLKKQTYSVALPKGGKKGKKESERDEPSRDISGGKNKIKTIRKAVNGKISKKAEMKPEVKINVDNIPLKQNGHAVMEHNEYLKETDNYSDYEVEPPTIQMPPPLSMNGCTNTDRLSPFHYVNLPPIQHNFSLTASRQEPFTQYVPQSSSDYMADDELRYQANHLRRIQKQRLKEERRKMRHVELYQNSPHFFLNQGEDTEVVGSGIRTETVDESHLEESRRGSRRRRYKRREKPDFSSQEDSSLNGAYDADEPETLQRTREKMHKLLDDAFQLIARHEKKKISPSVTPLGGGCTRKSSIGKRRTRRQRPNLLETPSIPCHRKSSPSDSTPEEKLDRLHTPLFLHNHYSPCNRHRVNPGIPPPWNAAGDEAAKIAAEHQAWSSPYVSPRLNRPKLLLNSSDPREEMCLPTISYPSDHNLTDFGCQPTFSFSRPRLSSQFSPYASSRPFQNRHSGYHSVDNSDDTPTSLFQPSTSCFPQNIENSIELNTFEPPSFAKHLSRSPASSKTSPIDDEIDAVHNNVKQEAAPQPLIQSIRDELMRLSNENGERNSLRSRIVLG